MRSNVSNVIVAELGNEKLGGKVTYEPDTRALGNTVLVRAHFVLAEERVAIPFQVLVMIFANCFIGEQGFEGNITDDAATACDLGNTGSRYGVELAVFTDADALYRIFE